MANTIGIVGGMGAYAGIDLLRKIADYTRADKDADHLPVIMISEPHRISDRSEFLEGQNIQNPGIAIAAIVRRLADQGARLIGLACNTAHVPEILTPVMDAVPAGVKLINMIREVSLAIKTLYPSVKTAGVLGTNGIYKSKVYDKYLSEQGIEAVYPSGDMQFSILHPAIYDPEYGIKAKSNPVTKRAKKDIEKVISYLTGTGSEIIIVACTEIPLALEDDLVKAVRFIDAAEILAKTLVREAIKA